MSELKTKEKRTLRKTERHLIFGEMVEGLRSAARFIEIYWLAEPDSRIVENLRRLADRAEGLQDER